MQIRPRRFTRSLAIQQIRDRLVRDSFPRMQMTLLVSLTGAAGLLASFSLLHLGLHSMAARYPLALCVAYLFFLVLVWLWLRTNAKDYLDVPDLPSVFPVGGGSGFSPGMQSGGGGDFGGGGASGDFEGAAAAWDSAADTSGSAAGDALGAVAGSDDAAVPLVVIALVVGLALASLYIVYIAPILFAEVLVDSGLSYALLRRLRKHDEQSWLVSAFKRTAIPFAATALFLAVVGAAMAFYAPGAASIGQVMKYAASQ
ncbi:MAG: hypothetical protein V4864_21345 [Pseudomonadota bacterium]